MSLVQRKIGKVTLVENHEEKWSLYIFNSEEIESYLEELSNEGSVKDIGLSLLGCDFIDSKGLSILIHVSLKLREKGGNFYLVNIPEHLKETLWHARSSGLSQWLEFGSESELESV